MTKAAAAIRCLLEDVAAARRWKERKGGQQAGGPPIFWSLPPSALIYLERTLRDGLEGTDR